MDELYLDYDPRNAVVVRPPMINHQNRPINPYGYAVPGSPIARPPAMSRPPLMAAYHPPAAVPVSAYYGAPPPAYYPPGYDPTAATKLGNKLSDLTVGDVVPLLAQLIIAFRPMPTPPSDEGRLETNVVNLTKFVEAIGRHFHADQQLQAAGSVAGTFLR